MVDLPLPVSPTMAMLCPGLHVEVEVAQHFLTVRILEGDVVEGDISLNGGPVLLFGVEAVAIGFDHLGGIGDFRHSLQQRHHTLGGGLRLLHFRKPTGDVADGLKNLGGVAHEGRKRTDGRSAKHRYSYPPR